MKLVYFLHVDVCVSSISTDDCRLFKSFEGIAMVGLSYGT